MNSCIPPVLDPTQTALLNIKLKEANDAYHSLITGTAAKVIVDRNGERVEFTPANKQALASYILQMQNALGLNTPCGLLPAGPAMFTF